MNISCRYDLRYENFINTLGKEIALFIMELNIEDVILVTDDDPFNVKLAAVVENELKSDIKDKDIFIQVQQYSVSICEINHNALTWLFLREPQTRLGFVLLTSADTTSMLLELASLMWVNKTKKRIYWIVRHAVYDLRKVYGQIFSYYYSESTILVPLKKDLNEDWRHIFR